MASGVTIPAPVFSGVIDQNYLIEPLQGAQSPLSYLDRFPDGLYNKSIDSHLVKLLYTLIGPAGVGGLKTNFLQARLIFESQGLNLFDMDAFYGNPFAFGRILEETYNQNIQGLLSTAQWNAISAQDEAYRTRAINFFKGVRAGNSPLGMQLVAQSGLNHAVEILENYRYLYDIHSDDSLGLPYFGQTNYLEEFIIVPRQELPQSTQQVLSFQQNYGDAGNFYLTYMGQQTDPIPVGANALTVQAALEGLSSIGPGNIQVLGGPNPNPFSFYFRGQLANQQTDTIKVISEVFQAEITGNIPVAMSTNVTQSGFETFNEVFNISDQNKYDLQTAIDYIRAVITYPTVNTATGKTQRQPWNSITESSSYVETRTFVTGQSDVSWPPVDTGLNWIEADVEKEAPSIAAHSNYHYVKFYRPQNVYAYTDAILTDPTYLDNVNDIANFPNLRTGPFSAPQIAAFPFLAHFNNQIYDYKALAGLNPQPDPVLVSGSTPDGVPLFNDYYSTRYIAEAYSQTSSYFYRFNSQRDFYFGYYYHYSGTNLAPFWSSSDRTSGTDYIEIDLGSVQAVNFLMFELIRKPINIEIDYDVLDDPLRRRWAPLYPAEQGYFETGVVYSKSSSPWEPLQYVVETQKGSMPYTRFIRIGLTRRSGTPSLSNSEGFLWNAATQTQNPWSIELRNLRVGRNINQVGHHRSRYYNVPSGYWL